MKIYINNRNYLTWPKGMAEKLSNDGHEIIFIDNGSTYEPLLDYYSTCGYEVIRLENVGNIAAWVKGIVTDLKEPYVVTDPDYDLSDIPSDWAEVLLSGFEEFPHIDKFGFSWEEKTVPQENPAWLADQFNLHPEGLPMTWGNKLPNNWLGYPNDTSFAVYRPGIPFQISGIRKGRPYTGIHLPWHLTLDPSADPTKRYVLFDDEIEYYWDHVEHSSCSAPRLAPMLAEYKRRKNG
jgi:hypothetical protein